MQSHYVFVSKKFPPHLPLDFRIRFLKAYSAAFTVIAAGPVSFPLWTN